MNFFVPMCGAQFLTLSRAALSCAVIASIISLSACGGGGGGGDNVSPAVKPDSISLSGVAAVGAPINGATVSVQCATPVSIPQVITDDQGRWTVSLPQGVAFPCAIAVSGGTVSGIQNTYSLHSYATAGGNVNTTPLTDLIIAVAVGRDPHLWFAGLNAAHSPALGAKLQAAQKLILKAFIKAGYILPGGAAFDPLTITFTATPKNPYDALLDDLASSLATTRTSYASLLAHILSGISAGNDFSIPVIDATSPPATPIVLEAKSQVQSADIASLVGVYAGTFGSLTYAETFSSLFQRVGNTASCSIEMKANGTMAVTADGKTVEVTLNGDIGDLIMKVNNVDKVMAFDFASNAQGMIEVVRGRVVGASASDSIAAVSCTVANPNVTTAGSATAVVTDSPAPPVIPLSTTVEMLNGATAADLDPGLVGTYSNDACTVKITAQGKVTVSSGAAVYRGVLGGDEHDSTSVDPLLSTDGFKTQEVSADGHIRLISFGRQLANPAQGVPSTRYSASTRFEVPGMHIMPPPPFLREPCQDLVKHTTEG